MLKKRKLAIKILCQKYSKNFIESDVISIIFTIFAIPKIGFFPRKELIFRKLTEIIILKSNTEMLQPKRTKFRREQKNRMKGNSQRGNQLAFGSFGIKTLENCWLTAQQIEAARQAISRRMNREGQIWIRVFPVKPITKKPLDTRMGKGKGDPYAFVAPITPGRIIFEAEGVPLAIAKEAMRLGANKLPVATKFVVRRDYVE